MESVTFLVDPICPWTYVTAGWIASLERQSLIDVSWGAFSLELANLGTTEAVVKGHVRSELSLRTLVAVREEFGQDAAGDFYRSVADRFHLNGEPLERLSTVQDALVAASLPQQVAEQAMATESTWEAVRTEHEALRELGSFGVPTLILKDAGDLAMFGPILHNVPDDTESVELWGHVSWLIRYGNFAELKRDRRPLDLWSYRHFRERIEAFESAADE